MFINEGKSNFGMFSRAGAMSTEKYHILMKKDEILNGKKKISTKNYFESEVVVSN